MTADTVNSLFTLFSAETDTEKYAPLISSAMAEVEKMLKPDADSTDIRLDYLCASLAAVRYAQITAVKSMVSCTYGGTASREGNAQLEYNFARALFEEYRKYAADLLCDNGFMFSGIKEGQSEA